MSKGTVVVTGASSGIGFSTSIEFSKKGYNVIAGARRLEPMKPLEEYGIKIVELDVTSTESIKKVAKLIEADYNSELKYLYNNAGQSCTFPGFEVSDENLMQCYNVNVFGCIRTTRELTPYLIKAKGTVGFTGSVSGLLPFPFSSVYSSTKAAIHSYANTVAFELEPFGVKVINIITGGVKTNIADTRPLPADSIYQTEGIEEVLVKRREMAVRNNPMSAEDFAVNVVRDFETSKIGKINYYEGSKARLLKFFSMWPRFLIILVFKKKFGLKSLFEVLGKKFG